MTFLLMIRIKIVADIIKIHIMLEIYININIDFLIQKNNI